MKKPNLYKIVNVIVIIIMVMLIIISLFGWYEYINVGLLKNTYRYPWGHEESGPNYASPEIYSKSALQYSIITTIIAAILLFGVIKKNKIFKIIGILILIITIIINHLN